jgi:hypothetical protein
MRHIILFVTISLFCFGNASAQQAKDTLFLMNGKIYVSKVLDTLLGGITIKDTKDSDRQFTIDNDDLFSVHYVLFYGRRT